MVENLLEDRLALVECKGKEAKGGGQISVGKPQEFPENMMEELTRAPLFLGIRKIEDHCSTN
jgi:hypothetical protein